MTCRCPLQVVLTLDCLQEADVSFHRRLGDITASSVEKNGTPRRTMSGGEPSETDHYFADLTSGIMHVLPAVNEAVAAHRSSGCPWCGVGEQPACPLLGLAGAVLDLVIR